MAAWHWGGDGSVMNDPLGAPGSTPLYLCLPPVRGSAGGDYYFPTTRGMHMETPDKKKSFKSRDCLVQRHLFSVTQGAGSSCKPRETEHSIEGGDLPTVGHLPVQETLQGAGSCGISTRGASNSKPVEVEGLQFATSVVKWLQLARPKLSGAARRKLKKTTAGQSGTRGLVQPGHKTSSQQTMGPKRPRLVGCTLTGQPPKKPRCPMEPKSYREALLSFKAAILLDHPEDKLSEEDRGLLLEEIGRVFCETPAGECPLLRSYRIE